MQGQRISSVQFLLQAGSPSAWGLERVTLQHVSAPSCAACHSSAHPWACSELQWHAGVLGGPNQPSEPAGPEHPHAAQLVPSPGEAFSV